MPYVRKLPSGLWQATVRHPSGKRYTKTDALKKVVNEWAKDLETRYARGELRDPHAGRIEVGEWYERRMTARGIEPVTRDKITSCWDTHCKGQWATWPMDAVTRMEAQEWVNVLQKKRRARHQGRDAAADAPVIAASTVHTIVFVMSGLFDAAVRERPPIILSNPFADLDLPEIAPTSVEFLTHEEADALVGVLNRDFGEQWGTLVETGLHVGLRPGEIFGLHGDRVNWLRQQIEVTRVQTRHGLREYPKSKRSHRSVPIPDWLTPRISTLMIDRPRDSIVFAAARGGYIDDADFRHRIWVPAAKAAGIRPCSPRIMRHTAASWLVMDGVDLYRVQAMLGHESFRTTQIYAHLAPSADDKIRESWRRMSDARGWGSKKASG